jgi:hypothetical protein
MKTISYKSIVAAAVALVILFGANSAEIPTVIHFFGPEQPQATGFASAHAAMPIPDSGALPAVPAGL